LVTEARTTVALYSRGRARRSLIDTIFFRVLSQAATILGYIVLVRGMQEEDFGVLNLLYAFIPVLSTVASLGLEQTLRRYQPEYLSAENGPAAAWLVRVTASARFGSNVILLSIVLLTWNHVAPFFKLDPYRGAFVIFCALVLLHFQARILQIALAGHMMHRFSVGSMAMLAISKLAGYALLDLSDQFTLDNVIIVDTVGYAVAFGLMRIVYRSKGARLDTARGGRPPPLERRRMLRYGLLNNFNDAGTLMLTSKTDNFFIAAIIDPLSVAVYAFYTRLSEMTTHLQPARLFENVVQPLVFAVPQNEASRRLPEYFTLLLNIGLAVQWPILTFVVAFHAEVVMLVFGGKYIDYSWMLPLIVGFATLNCIANPVTLVAQYRERAGVILASKLFGIYNAVALLVLVPLAGVYGAAIATGTAQLMKNSFIWWHVREDARWTNVSGSLSAGLALWGGTLLACRAAATWMPGGAAADVAVGAAIIALVSLLHVRGPAFAPGDRRILGSVFQGREARLLRRLGVVQAVPRAD
jgi:O-antigen/teichoic acid export membrane protein